jgi:general secretion pathway protein G
MYKRTAFTLIELIFVIVVLGILASIALPKLGSTVEQALIAEAQGDVSSIRAAIASERQKELVKGNNAYPNSLGGTSGNGKALFGNVLTYPIYSKGQGGWTQSSGDANKYTFTVETGNSVDFDYNNTTGIFNCDHTKTLCKKIAE